MSHPAQRIVRCICFKRVSVLCEMLTASSKIRRDKGKNEKIQEKGVSEVCHEIIDNLSEISTDPTMKAKFFLIKKKKKKKN